jgi:hypothetical protein
MAAPKINDKLLKKSRFLIFDSAIENFHQDSFPGGKAAGDLREPPPHLALTLKKD